MSGHERHCLCRVVESTTDLLFSFWPTGAPWLSGHCNVHEGYNSCRPTKTPLGLLQEEGAVEFPSIR